MDIKKELQKHARPDKAKILQRFFKTGKGQYGEGDKFIGVTMPEQRAIAKKFTQLSLTEIQALLNSKVHEHRMTGLIVLVNKYKQSKDKKKYYDFYLKNTNRINNWDLVDVTSPHVVGHYLFDKDRSILYQLARSKDLWEKRISIISTFYFIREEDFNDSLKIAEILLKDKHDLIHKAVGWMLREIGKKDQAVEERFLIKHYKHMPRTMLRYAIERFDEKKRMFYMKK